MNGAPHVALIGWPIGHARSPLVHNFWLKELGLAGSYTKQGVKPEDVAAFLKNLVAEGYAGINATVPHKEAVFKLADERLPDAVAVGAANTLWIDDGKLVVTNTDTYGFMTHLDETAPGWQADDRPVAILGAGGAARAIVHGFVGAGVCQVKLCNRTRARSEALADHFGARVVVVDWAERSSMLADVSVLVNTTTLGMTGAPPLDINLARLPPSAVVADAVYAPLQTGLLQAAEARGLRTVDGLGMLLHQAVPGFEKWFGVRPTVSKELRDFIVADLGATPC